MTGAGWKPATNVELALDDGGSISSELRDALSERYRIVRNIATGGSATVFLARDLRHGRDVAIKVLNRHISSAVGAERFIREIRTAAQLMHPHILPLHDSGEVGGCIFYVMPFVEGGTLREWIARAAPFPVSVALNVAREVGDALAYAHAHGVIHRDAKPENILVVSGDHVAVADFGVARTFEHSQDGKLTSEGVALGTPLYMSPEQADGSAHADERSDIYSLACVVFEMLTGAPPFEAMTAMAVLQKHVSTPPPSARERRAEVPEVIDAALLRAMSKSKDDRFQDMPAFLRAMGIDIKSPERAQTVEPVSRPPASRSRRWWIAGAAVAIAAMVAATWRAPIGARMRDVFSPAPALDTTRFVVLPFVADSGLATLPASQLVYDALARWRDISVVDLFQVSDVVRREGVRAMDAGRALDVARQLGAGRFVRGEVRREGDSLRVYAILYDAARGGRPIRDGFVRVGLASRFLDSSFAQLADHLIFGGGAATAPMPSETRSVLARQAYLAGQLFLRDWNAAAAESAFASALRRDGDYSHAALWLAQVQAWTHDNQNDWKAPAALALRNRERLTTREQALAVALVQLAAGDATVACATYDKMRLADSTDFAAWFGLGECRRRDRVVLRTVSSPSGWQFRSSYSAAIRAYQRAFLLLPSSILLFRDGGYDRLEKLLLVRSGSLFAGVSSGADAERFAAIPAWSQSGDTLELIPYPLESLSRSVPATRTLALARNRAVFQQVVGNWTTTHPNNADALEALALALDLTGSPGVLDTLGRARNHAADLRQRRRLLGLAIWATVKQSALEQPQMLRQARVLCDSLLADSANMTNEELNVAASAALLTGRPAVAARLMARAAKARPISVRGEGTTILPPAANAPVEELTAYAALGGPVDSIVALERRARFAIRQFVDARSLRGALEYSFRLPATLAFPRTVLPVVADLRAGGDLRFAAVQSLYRSDSAAAREHLRAIANIHEIVPAADRTADIALVDAELQLVLGSRALAIQWLDELFASLRWSPLNQLNFPAQVAAWPRALALRAQVESARSSSVPSRYLTPLDTLWRHAETKPRQLYR